MKGERVQSSDACAEARAALEVLDELLRWADRMGGWEASVWRRARAVVRRQRAANAQPTRTA